MSFNLENQISEWKRKLRKYRHFEDGDIDELEDHLRNRLEEIISSGHSEQTAFEQIMNEDYKNLERISEQFKTQRANPSILPGMLSNYFKVGLRFFGRTKLYFSINLIGLIIGLTSVLYIVFYIHYELNYDHFHKNNQEIYRVNLLMQRATGKLHYPIIPPAFGPAIKENVSNIESTTRLRYTYNVLMQSENQSFYEEKVFFAESEFLKMFTFKWLDGNQSDALSEINTVVLTKTIATKYFGTENPVGKVVTYNNEIDLRVVGVIDDIPENSHFSFDFLISFETFKPGPGSLEPMTSWKWLGFLTYIQTSPNSDTDLLKSQILELFKANNNSSNNLKVEIELQALPDIYLTSGHLSNPQGGLFRVNEKDNLLSLGVIAILIIVVSFFNYFNITSSLMHNRSKEMGIRKIFGSSRRKVYVQMGSETLIITFCAAVVSWVLILLLSKNGLISFTSSGFIITLGITLGIIILFTSLSSILFGSTFSSYNAIALLQKKFATAKLKSLSFGRLILLLQFGISSALIMVSIIVISQLSYFSKKDLGYDQTGVLMAQFRSQEMHTKRNRYVDEMLTIPQVKAVSFGPSLDGSSSGGPLRLREWPEDQVIQTAYFGVDYQFQDALGLEMVEGRFFSESFAKDSTESLLINERLADMLDVEDPIGKKVDFTSGTYEIIGIYKDFHYKSLHHEIGPMALKMWLGQPRNVMIRYQTEDLGPTLQLIESKWQEVFSESDFPFDYRFLDEQLQSMYGKEQEFASLLQVFTLLAIFLALLGLFGLSSINIQQRIKQIGIRRVLGAEVGQIASVVSKRYLVTAILGIILSFPFAYLFMRDWLNNYAYSITLDGRFSVITLILVMLITVLTLAFQVYRVMTVNPASILRDE